MKMKFVMATAALALCAAASAGDGCPGDLDGNANVDVQDLLIVLSDWQCTSKCAGDANGDGIVDVQDILEVLMSWGPCGASGCTTNADCNDGDACTVDFCIMGTCYNLPFPGPGCGPN
ncbi:MAG: hypothetical protein ACKOYN_12865 [Planctomycetota bacterium]